MNSGDIIKNLDAIEIQKYQWNRYPMLFIDKVLECKVLEYAKAIKCFSYNEWFFPIHFTDEPVVPGFVLIEMMTQTFLMTFLSCDECKSCKTAANLYDKISITEKVVPGDVLTIDATLKKYSRGVAYGIATAKNQNDKTVCQGEFRIVVPDVLNKFKPTINNSK